MWKVKGSQGSTKLQAVIYSEVQYLTKAVIQGISLYKINASMTIRLARVFEGR